MPKPNKFEALSAALKGEALPEQEVVTPEPPPAIATPEKRGRPAGKRSNPDYTQVGAYVPRSLKKQVDRILVDADIDFSDLVTQLLEKWVSAQSDK